MHSHQCMIHHYKDADNGHFHLEVAEQLIKSFHFWQRSGHPPRHEHATSSQLDKQLGHYPIQDTKS